MGIFDKKRSISREELKSVLGKDRGIIPGTGGKKYSERERQEMSRKLFGSEYGSEIDKNDWRKRMRKLDSEKREAKTSGEKRSIEGNIRYLKEKIGGKRV